MDLISIVIIVFGVLEISNVLLLYFAPESRMGNGIGVFNAYEKSKKDPEVHALVRYLINWVAGTKLIFLALLVVILITGDLHARIYSTIALILSILTFYWKLYPAIRSMDNANQITPKGYSRTLGLMILGFILVFTGALAYYYLTGSF